MKDQESDEIRRHYELFLDKRFQKWSEKGSNLSDTLRDFLREVAERDWVWSQDERGAREFAEAMSPRQRQYKSEVRRKLKSGLADLAALSSFIAAPKVKGIRPRFREKDIEEILDLGDLLSLVRFAVRQFGREYADPILRELRETYRVRHEEIVIQRKILSPGGFG